MNVLVVTCHIQTYCQGATMSFLLWVPSTTLILPSALVIANYMSCDVMTMSIVHGQNLLNLLTEMSPWNNTMVTPASSRGYNVVLWSHRAMMSYCGTNFSFDIGYFRYHDKVISDDSIAEKSTRKTCVLYIAGKHFIMVQCCHMCLHKIAGFCICKIAPWFVAEADFYTCFLWPFFFQ